MREFNVIGGTSPLGIDLTRHLINEGGRVRMSCRSKGRVPLYLRECPSVEIGRLDLDPGTDFTPFLSGTVVWLAHLDQGRSNELEVETNIAVFERFLSQATRADVSKIIFVSSGGSVYGEPETLPIREDHPLRPLSSYGKAKAAMERLLIEMTGRSALPTAILRPGNIYGFSDPNRDIKGIVAAFIDALAGEKPFTLIHEGRTVRDFIHVDDVVSAISAAAESREKNVVWNVATGSGNPTIDIIEMISRAAERQARELIRVDNFETDVEQSVLSIARIKSRSDWSPRISLDAGIARTVAESRARFSR